MERFSEKSLLFNRKFFDTGTTSTFVSSWQPTSWLHPITISRNSKSNFIRPPIITIKNIFTSHVDCGSSQESLNSLSKLRHPLSDSWRPPSTWRHNLSDPNQHHHQGHFHKTSASPSASVEHLWIAKLFVRCERSTFWFVMKSPPPHSPSLSPPPTHLHESYHRRQQKYHQSHPHRRHGTDRNMMEQMTTCKGTDSNMLRKWPWHVGSGANMLRNESWHDKERTIAYWIRWRHDKERIVTDKKGMTRERSHFRLCTLPSPISLGALLLMLSSELHCRQSIAHCPVVGCIRFDEAECQSRMDDRVLRNRWWHDGTRAGVWRNRRCHAKELIMTCWIGYLHVKEQMMTC